MNLTHQRHPDEHDTTLATDAPATRQDDAAMADEPQRPTQIGDQLLGPSGLIWTVAAFTPRGDRVVLDRPTPEGPAAMIVDVAAVHAMVRLRPADQ